VLGGLKIEEVAQVLGKKAGAVQALQQRGLLRLRKKITEKAVSL